MGEPPNKATAADAEAAGWFARLGARSVSASTLSAFQSWREIPENAAAYRRVETLWRQAGDLHGDPDIRRAVAAAARPRPPRSRAVRIVAPLAGALACVAVAALVWNPSRGAYATGVGEQKVVRLDDGSTVRLDTASRIRVRFRAGRRSVELRRGRALFNVAPDPSRPFVVEAGATRVTAVGTVFDVRRSASAVTVTLVRGRVDVAPADGPARAPRRLAPGQQTVVSGARQETRAVDAAAQTSWTEGRLVFRDVPLQAAVGEVNRYLTDPIVLQADGLESVRVSGVFQTGDRDAFVAAASDLFDLQALPSPGGSVTLARRRNNSREASGSPDG